MKTLLTLSVISLTVIQVATARLGESLDQLKARFGEPQEPTEATPRLVKVPDGRELRRYVFSKDGVPFTETAILENGKVVFEAYTRSLKLLTSDGDIFATVANLDVNTIKEGDLPAIDAVKNRLLWSDMKTQLAAVLDANSEGKKWTLAPFEGVEGVSRPEFKNVETGDRGLDQKCQLGPDKQLLKAWVREDGDRCEFQITGSPEPLHHVTGKVSAIEVQAFMVADPLIAVVAYTPSWFEINKLIIGEQDKKEKLKDEQKKKDVGI